METKKCPRCLEQKQINEFLMVKGRPQGRCFICRRLTRIDNKEQIVAYNKEYRKLNQEKRRIYNNEYVKKNKEKHYKRLAVYRDKNRERVNRIARESTKRNRAKIQEKHRHKLDTDPVYKLKRKFYCFIKDSFRRQGFPKKGHNREIIGCEYEFFIQYIEAQFVKGMNWNNIHIDHIKPLNTAETEDDVVKLCHYSNLQPLFIADNIKKKDKPITKQLRLL